MMPAMNRELSRRLPGWLGCIALTACAGTKAGSSVPPAGPPPPPPAGPVPFVYVSGYRPEIHIFRLDPESGRLDPRSQVAAGKDPSFLAVHPSGRFLFAVNEVDEGRVLAFSIDQATGALTRLDDQTSGGVGPAHLSVDRGGRFVLVANYAGQRPGTVAVLPIGADGRLATPVDTHDFGPGTMPHFITTDPGNRFVFAPCKGGPYVAQLRWNAMIGQIEPNQPPSAPSAGQAGPRHLDFHPNGRFAYVINESALTVAVYDFDAKRGLLREIESLPTLPAGVTDRKGFSAADLHVHPNGQLLYGSNRGHNSIVIFRIDPRTGRLTLIGHESRTIATPRNFHIDPSGTWLLAANQSAGNVAVFRIDPATGLLEPTATVESGPSPSYVGVVLLPGR
jgi:6-phosphogluconolactonase